MRSLTTLFLFITALTSHGQISVEFELTGTPQDQYTYVGIRGNQAPLSWYESIPLSKINGKYSVQLDFPDSVEGIEYKFVLYNSDKKVVWENIENRSETLKGKTKLKSFNEWNVEQFIDPGTLPRLSVESLMKDFELIKTMILEVHPATYRYNDSTSIQNALNELEASFSFPISHGGAYLAISKLLAQIKCGHTFASPYNQNALVKSVIHRQEDKMPFTFKWIEGKMIVEYDATANQKISRGSEIISINKVPVRDILNRIIKYVPADGSNTDNAIAQTQIRGYSFAYDLFDVFYPLLFSLTSNHFNLEVKLPGTIEAQTVIVAPITRKNRSKVLAERYSDFPDHRNDLWNFEINKDNIGIMTLNSFSFNGWKKITIDYKQFFAEAFSQLRNNKVNNLIIDIRKNDGGSDEVLAELTTYFNINEIKDTDFEGRSRYVDLPETLRPHVKTWGPDPWYFHLKPDNNTKVNGYYIFRKEFVSTRKNRIKKNAFKGNIYVLTSPSNVSLAFYMAQYIKKYNIGTLIGEETGGNLKGINGGQILFLTLPNTEIEIDLPIIGAFATQDQPDTGVTPDIKISQTLSDFYQGIDTQMEAALKKIEEN